MNVAITKADEMGIEKIDDTNIKNSLNNQFQYNTQHSYNKASHDPTIDGSDEDNDPPRNSSEYKPISERFSSVSSIEERGSLPGNSESVKLKPGDETKEIEQIVDQLRLSSPSAEE